MTGAMTLDWDAFISHASEDKDSFARPLYQRLQKLGLKIWLDEFTLTIGDSLRRSIDAGLANSRYGIVVISPSFLQKEWPQRELDGLVAKEIDGVKVILPVWHQLNANQVRKYSPTLADRLAATSSEGVERVATRLFEAIQKNAPAWSVVKTIGSSGSSRGNTLYCARCGATPGIVSQCPHYGSHNFVSSSGANVYCVRCGATPGVASQCPHYGSHNFVSA
jgi:TIR domain